MKKGEKFYIKSFSCESTEDDFNHGEKTSVDSCWGFKDFHLDDEANSFETIDKLLEKVCDLNCFDFNKKNWLHYFLETNENEDIGRFDTDILVDENNNEATEEEIKWWKNGEKRLWNCHIVVFVGVKSLREPTMEDF